MIEEFRASDIKGSEGQYEEDEDERTGTQVSRASLYIEDSEASLRQDVTVRDLKLLRDREMRKRKSAVHLVNRKSQAYVGDSFLKFHLLQNFMFYAVLFTIPSVSVVDCHLGHSFFSYVAIGAFMLIVFAIDVISLRQHVKKELIKLELKNFYGYNKRRSYLLAYAVIWGEALLELVLTQLNIFDIYTDFAFITIVYQGGLTLFFTMSLTSFCLTMIPKLYSFSLILQILCSSQQKFKTDAGLEKEQLVSSAFDGDLRRKMIFRAFTFSEFRSQALCVDYLHYEIFKTELLMASLKFALEDLP